MSPGKQWLTILSALALGISGLSVSAQGAARQCTSEECACEEALEQNTVEALEEFLRKYPQSASSACAALAVPPPDEISGPGNQGTVGDGAPAQAAVPQTGD